MTGSVPVLSGDSYGVIVVVCNYKVCNNMFYESCCALGMHLKFRYRRRIHIAPSGRAL